MTFVAKHLVAAAVVIAGGVIVPGVLYVALLIFAAATNGDLGGPLALPFLLVGTFAFSAGSVAVLLFPVTALAELLRKKLFRASRFVEIPIATLLLVSMMTVALPRLELTVALVVAAIELVLLGVYWWSLQATETLSTGIKQMIRVGGHHVRLYRARRAAAGRTSKLKTSGRA